MNDEARVSRKYSESVLDEDEQARAKAKDTDLAGQRVREE